MPGGYGNGGASISSPHGRSVGLPKSSWFHQLPSRPIPCAIRRPGREAVGEEPDVRARPLRDDPADEAAERDAAPHSEAAAPDREHAPPLVRHLVPARDDVVDPRADDPGRDAPHGATEDEIPVAAAVDPAPARDVRAHGDRSEQREAVHVDGERPELERARAGRGDRREKAHRGRILPGDWHRQVPVPCGRPRRLTRSRGSGTYGARPRPSPFARSSPSAESFFSSPASPIPARISGAFVNWISR